MKSILILVLLLIAIACSSTEMNKDKVDRQSRVESENPFDKPVFYYDEGNRGEHRGDSLH